jgi:transposase InsO family protein
MDATDTAAPETRYRGRSQALLYNEVHPHKALGYRSPREFIAAHGSS